VNKDFCVKGEAESIPIWSDAGSKAKEDLSLFTIVPKDSQGLEVGTFYVQKEPGTKEPNPTSP
jgi:hypothetical protein